MIRKAARLVSALCVAALLCSCRTRTDKEQADKIEREKTVADDRVLAPVDPASLPIETETLEKDEEESSSYRVLMEDEILKEQEEPEVLLSEVDTPPSDTVKYIASERKEIMEVRQAESVVDESDPATYQVIRTNQQVSVTEQVPEEYVNDDGYVKYAYKDGAWYEYRYSTGNLALDEKDEDKALFLLNLDGFYDGYEVAEVECEDMPENTGAEFSYHVLYEKEVAMEEAPTDVEHLTVSKSRQETIVQDIPVLEKVPVLLEEECGTGKYMYYGWQELDGNTYYFDENGDKVTGSQVIQGIRHMFDEDGARTSRAGIVVSSQNGIVDWEAMKSAGIEYALIRCGYRGYTNGALILDSRCEENIIGARNAGIEAGIFFFSQAMTEKEAVEEANLIVSLAEQYQLDTPLVIESSCAALDSRGRADGLNAHDRTVCVDAFCRTVQNAGYTPMLRVEKGWLEKSLEKDALSAYPLWLVQFNSDVTYSGPYKIWQYTNRGTMYGIGGNIGLTISYGK